jgi:hypothetical protein
MSVNSKFNCLYCLALVFYPINFCLDPFDAYFCSLVQNTLLAQLYKIGLVSYFAEAIKLCSNITYILTTVNRYMLIGREHSAFLQSISKWDLSTVVKLSVLVSFVANIGNIFKYYVNQANGFVGSPIMVYLYDVYPEVNMSFSVLPVYLIVYFAFNYLFFLVISTLLEALIVRKLHNELTEKRKKMAEMSGGSGANDASNAEKMKADEKRERRALVMVVINSALNVILRLCDLFIVLQESNYLISGSSDFLENTPNLLIFVVNLSYFTFILTFTTNFFMFYLFNRKFKETIHLFFGASKQK